LAVKCNNKTEIQFIYAYILPFIGKPLFIPIMRVLLRAFNCNYARSNSPYVTWSDDPSLICWQGLHIIMVILSAISLLMYYPFAIRLVPAWQYLTDNLDIQYRSSYLIIQYQLKFIFVFLTVFLTYIPLAYLIICTIGITVFVLLVFAFSPANNQKVNFWSKILFSCAFWTVICSLTTYFMTNGENSIIPTIMFFIGNAFIIIIGFVLSNSKFCNRLYENSARKTKTLMKLTALNNVPSTATELVNTEDPQT